MATEALHDCSNPQPTDGDLPLLDYALLDVCTDGTMKSQGSDTTALKNSGGVEEAPKSVCEYTVVEPFKP